MWSDQANALIDSKLWSIVGHQSTTHVDWRATIDLGHRELQSNRPRSSIASKKRTKAVDRSKVLVHASGLLTPYSCIMARQVCLASKWFWGPCMPYIYCPKSFEVWCTIVGSGVWRATSSSSRTMYYNPWHAWGLLDEADELHPKILQTTLEMRTTCTTCYDQFKHSVNSIRYDYQGERLIISSMVIWTHKRGQHAT